MSEYTVSWIMCIGEQHSEFDALNNQDRVRITKNKCRNYPDFEIRGKKASAYLKPKTGYSTSYPRNLLSCNSEFRARTKSTP